MSEEIVNEIQFNLLPNTITLQGYDERLSSLKNAKIIIPIIFLNKSQSYKEAYQEAVLSYLFGLPISSIVLSGKCMELAIKDKYKQIGYTEITLITEKSTKKVDMSRASLFQLTKCKEFSKLNLDEDDVGYLRILRNYIHKQKIFKLQTALEAINRVSEIINLLYPWEVIPISITCTNCRQIHNYGIKSDSYLLANDLPLKCLNRRGLISHHTYLYKIGINGVKT